MSEEIKLPTESFSSYSGAEWKPIPVCLDDAYWLRMFAMAAMPLAAYGYSTPSDGSEKIAQNAVRMAKELLAEIKRVESQK